MALDLYVNIQARSVTNALVRSETDFTPVAMPELVIGDQRDYNLYFVDGLGGFASWSGSGSYIPNIAIGICGNPSGGTFPLTFNGQTTAGLAYNITPAAMQTALQALSTIGSGNVLVTGIAGIYYKLTFVGALAGADQPEITGDGISLTPESVVSVDTITPGASGVNEVQLIQLRQNPITFANNWTPITNGWTGTLSTRTLEIVEALVAKSPITDTFQITVEDPSANRRTYLKTDAVISCTVIDPESFAGANKPTLATVAYVNSLALASGLTSYEALSSSATGNTNITRPTGSQHHIAVVTVSGTAGTRTISALTTNSPASGYRLRAYLITPATAGIILEVRNSTSAGTLIKSITTDGSGVPYFVDMVYNGSAWAPAGNNGDGMQKAQNLSGLGNIAASRKNLGSLFANVSDKSASFTAVIADDGSLFRITTSASAIVVTLPSASGVDSGYCIALLKVDGGSGSITTSPATETMALQNELMILQSDGSGWTVLFRLGRQVTGSGVLNFSALTGLSGGGSLNLDGLVTSDGRYPLGTIAKLSFGRASQEWQLLSGTDPNDPVNGTLRPTDYATSTNQKVWVKIA